MGRKRKKKNNTNTIGIIVIIIAIAVYAKMTILKDFNFLEEIQNLNIKMPNYERKIKVTERSVKEDYSEIQPELQKEQAKEKNNITQQKSIKKADKYVKIFFTKSSNGQDVYVALPRIKNGNKCSDIEYAVKTLLNGPTSSEKKNGIYSEIPSSTKLIYVKETQKRIIINLSSDFEFGGGGDSLYKRMYQLIKTVNNNTTKPVYLYINGKQANVIGGEGLMLKQPLRRNSLDD